MPVTSAASWYCAEYRERDTKRKSECQYSNVVVGLGKAVLKELDQKSA
jgi:hypothetical protein